MRLVDALTRRALEQLPGRTLLGAYLVLTNQEQTELAKRLDVTQATISRWLTGKRLPDPAARIDLEKACGIPEDAWER